MNKFFILSDALDYIENGLTEAMTQQEIADHCCCSLSSLQKMFRYTFHIGVADYVTRRRLTCCARELISTNRSVLDIAMAWGYNSPEVFTRAFTRVWGESPAVFRKNRRFSGLFPKFEIAENEKGVSEMTEIHRKYVISELYDYLSANRGAYLIAFDIKHLVPINEISSKAGDLAILESLHRMEAVAGEDDIVFRIGGDEFAMLTNSEDEAYAKELAKQILSHNGEPIDYDGRQVPVSLYAGIAKLGKKVGRYSEMFTELQSVIMQAKCEADKNK